MVRFFEDPETMVDAVISSRLFVTTDGTGRDGGVDPAW